MEVSGCLWSFFFKIDHRLFKNVHHHVYESKIHDLQTYDLNLRDMNNEVK